MRSLRSRTLHALVAVLTVWCLGCSSFDVLLDSLSSRAQDSASCMPGASGTGNGGAPATSPSIESASQPDFACHCLNCFGVVTTFAFQPVELTRPSEAPAIPLDWRSIDREPLVPPPLV